MRPTETPQDKTFLQDEEGRLAGGSICRCESEKELFKQALDSLVTFYSHPNTFVLMLTAFPPDYEEEGRYIRSGNVKPYFDRGRCFCESSWAVLVKDSLMALDLGKDTGAEWATDDDRDVWNGTGMVRSGQMERACALGRNPPVLPTAFRVQLKDKSFTNGKTDLPRVAELYQTGFEARFGTATLLSYGSLGWGAAEAAVLGEVLAAGAAPRLQILECAPPAHAALRALVLASGRAAAAAVRCTL